MTARAEYQRAWYQANKARLHERRRARIAADPEKHNEQCRSWHARNRKRSAELKIKSRYGLTFDQVEAMRAAQGGACAVCKRLRKLVVDHDHVTGKVRGLLCNGCNTVLGKMGDDPAMLRAAAAYLERAR